MSSRIIIDGADYQVLQAPENVLREMAARWSHDVIDHVPMFEYWNLDERRKMNRPDNICGYQQRAFDFYWAIRECALKGRIGLGIGTTTCMGICTLGTDKFCGESPDAGRYGDSYGYPHFKMDADSKFPFYDNKFAACFANHVLEHLQQPLTAVSEMLRITDVGGYVCSVMPDMTFCKKGTIDPTHVNEYEADEWFERMTWLKNNCSYRFTIVEHNTFDNAFSFNTVLRKDGDA